MPALSGIVYGTLLNHRSAFAALQPFMDQPPYKSPPRAPVLYVKPRNTLARDGATVAVPPDTPELEIGGCLGVVVGRTACHLQADAALAYVAGYVIVNDISIPHPNVYRPSIRFKCRDGFCPIGPHVTPRDDIASPDALEVRTFVNGELAHTARTEQLVRPVTQLLADVTEFMTLFPGDVLAVGVAWPIPLARPGQRVAIEIDGLGRLANELIAGSP